MTRPKSDPNKRYARRLSGVDAVDIRGAYSFWGKGLSGGMDISQLARKYGVSRTSIRAVVEGRTHRH